MQEESRVLKGHLRPDHVPMSVSIPPKYADSQMAGSIKGKSAIHIAPTYAGRKKNFRGQHFWGRGYYVATVGGMRKPFASISGAREIKTAGSTNYKLLADCRL